MNQDSTSTETWRLHRRFPGRQSRWRLGQIEIRLPVRPLLMGIVNVTPDSFSDGGAYFSPARAIEHGLKLEADGANILDVGGESTRPYADPVTVDEELRRVLPVVEGLCRHTRVPVSIDTSKADVASAAIAAGAQIINDVTGLEDPRMIDVAVRTQVGVCAMHMRGTPQSMQDNPRYDDVVQDVYAYLSERRQALVSAGLQTDQICLDPGLGFGKTHEHNLQLVAQCGRYHGLSSPLLVGPSRKGFIGKILGNQEEDRAAGTVGVALALASQGVQILRVHDVQPVFQALLLYEASGAIEGPTPDRH